MTIHQRKNKISQIRQKLIEDEDQLHEGGGQDEDGGSRNNCLYYISCCQFFKPDEVKLQEACKQLFELPENKKEAVFDVSYFQKHSKVQYEDLIGQLKLAVEMRNKESDLIDLLNQAQVIDYDTKELEIYGHFQDVRMTKYLEELNLFRQTMADVYSLADKDCDHSLYKNDEGLNTLQNIIEKQIPQIKNELLEEIDKTWLDEWKSLKRMQYHDVQKFVWYCKTKHNLDLDILRDEFYKKHVPCSWLHCICGCLFKISRSSMTKSRYQKKDHLLEQFSPKSAILNLLANVLHALDLYSDGYLAFLLYFQSRYQFSQARNSRYQNFENGQEQIQNATTNHYSLTFMMVSMAIFGPYIIQYSSLMSTYQNKGVFQKPKSYGYMRRAYIYITFTFIGLIIMPLLDLIFKIEAVLKVMSLPFQIRKDSKNQTLSTRFQLRMRTLIKETLMLNDFELQNFEKQKQYAQVLFEDLLMFILQVLIFSGVLRVTNLQSENSLIKNSMQSKALIISFVTTLISLIKTGFSLWFEGKGLQESLISYVMLSVNARINWVPFGQQIMKLDVKKDLIFNSIQFEVPLISKLFGFYPGITYIFSAESFKTFGQQIQTAIEKRKGITNENVFMPKTKFAFSVRDITIHDFCSFLEANYVKDPEFNKEFLDLSDIDWQQMIYNSRSYNLDFKNPKTIHGKSLLQVFIDNYDSQRGTRHLNILIELLFKQKEFVIDISDQSNLISLLITIYNEHNHKAFKSLLKHLKDYTEGSTNKFDINRTLKDGTTLYGYLIRQKHMYNKEKTRQYLSILLECFDEGLDINKKQIFDYGTLNTPLNYLVRYLDKTKYDSAQQRYDSQSFKDLFINKQFYLKLNGFLSAIYESQQQTSLQSSFEQIKKDLKESVGEDCPENDFMLKQDLRGNNIKHIFFDFQISKLSKENQKQLLNQNNNQGQTPISKYLNGSEDSFQFGELKRFFQEGLVDKSSIEGCKDQVIEGFTNLFIRQYLHDKRLDENKLDTKNLLAAFKEPDQARELFKKSFKSKNYLNIFQYFFNENEIQNSSQNQNQQQDQTQVQNNSSQPELKHQSSLYEPQPPKILPGDKIISPPKQIWHTKPDAQKHIVLETLLNGAIEISSMLDFISDWFVLVQLSESDHTAWFSFTLFTMLCPYYTVYSSLITFKLDQISRNSSFDFQQQCTCLLLISPVILIILFTFDIILMVVYTVMYLIMFIIISTKCGQDLYKKFDGFVNWLFMKSLGMSVMNFRGFKAQRTILQLQLESVPQIIFQIYLLWRIPYLLKYSNENINIDIDTGVLLVSVIMALVHMTLELINLILESSITQTRFIDYVIACYNARQGWIPFENKLINDYNPDKADDNKIILDTTSAEYCKGTIGFSAEFELSEISLNQLTKLFSGLSIKEDDQQLKLLVLGNWNENIKLKNIFDLLKLGHQKIKIEFFYEILKNKMQKDKSLMQLIEKQNGEAEDTDSLNQLAEMVKYNQPQVVQIMFHLGLKFKGLQEQFKDAYRKQYKNMFQVLMIQKLEDEKFEGIEEFVKDQELFHKEFEMLKRGIYLTQPLLLLDQKMIVNWKRLDNLVNYLFHNDSKLFDKHPEQCIQAWHVLFGNYIPDIIDKSKYLNQSSVAKFKQQIAGVYPPKFKLCNDNDKDTPCLQLESQFLCQFVVIRRALHVNSFVDATTLTEPIIDLTDELSKIDCTLDDVKNMHKVFQSEVEMKRAEIERCDRVITHLGFDKQWAQYYYNSRKAMGIVGEHTQNYFSNKTGDKAVEIKLEPNVKAVKELHVYKKHDMIEPFYFDVQILMKYDETDDLFVNKVDFNGQQFDQNKKLIHVFKFSHENDQNELQRLKSEQMTIMNNVTAGHQIRVSLYTKTFLKLDCEVKLTTYQQID